MLKQLTKILQEKYPRLEIEYLEIIFIYHTDGFRLIMEIHEDGIKHKGGITYLTAVDPGFFQTVDELIERSYRSF